MRGGRGIVSTPNGENVYSRLIEEKLPLINYMDVINGRKTQDEGDR